MIIPPSGGSSLAIGASIGNGPVAGDLLYVGASGVLAQAAVTGPVWGTGTTYQAGVAGTDFLEPDGDGSLLTGLTTSQISGLEASLLLKAPLASPVFTGTVIAPILVGGSAPGGALAIKGTSHVGVFGPITFNVATTVVNALGQLSIGRATPQGVALDVRDDSAETIGWGSSANQYGQLSWTGGDCVIRANSGRNLRLAAAGGTLGYLTILASNGFVGIGDNSPTSGLSLIDGYDLKLGTGGTPAKKIVSATAALDFPSVAAGGQQELTISVTGAVVNGSVELGPPAALEAGLIATGRVSAADTVTVRLSNITGSPIDPASGTYRAKVTNF